jgi:uncharacterized protein (DUF924 family)
MTTAGEVLAFWIEAGEDRWFTKSAAFDGAISIRFRDTLAAARNGACDHWAQNPRGALGLVILLDQFSRNLHRNSPLAFAADARALRLARACIAKGWHQALPAPLAQWFVLPYEHAEDLDMQWRGVALFGTMGLDDMAHWAGVHRDIIARFGRFPHRNAVLGRVSTVEETAFLKAGGFAG